MPGKAWHDFQTWVPVPHVGGSDGLSDSALVLFRSGHCEQLGSELAGARFFCLSCASPSSSSVSTSLNSENSQLPFRIHRYRTRGCEVRSKVLSVESSTFGGRRVQALPGYGSIQGPSLGGPSHRSSGWRLRKRSVPDPGLTGLAFRRHLSGLQELTF